MKISNAIANVQQRAADIKGRADVSSEEIAKIAEGTDVDFLELEKEFRHFAFQASLFGLDDGVLMGMMMFAFWVGYEARQ